MKKFKQKLKDVAHLFRSFNGVQYAIVWAVFSGLVLFVLLVLFITPKTTQYSFAQAETCVKNFNLFPTLQATKHSGALNVNQKTKFKVANLPLISTDTCFSLKNPNSEQESISLHPFKNSLFAKKITLNFPESPKLSVLSDTNLPTSIVGDVKLKLNSPDQTFSYKISSENKTSNCQSKNAELSCNLKPLELKQSNKYQLNIERYINEQKIDTPIQASIKTVDPITIKASSITNGSTVYDKPTQLILTTNKTLTSYTAVTLTNLSDNSQINIKSLTDKDMLVVNFKTELPRETTFKLTVNELGSSDQALLTSPYTLEFSTSGGPKVIGNNSVSYGESQYKNFVLSFDSDLSTNQNLSSLVSITGPSGPVNSTISASQRSISINPSSEIARCTNYTINVKPGIVNSAGVENTSPWSTNFRTICQEVFSIGLSVQGQSITAYKFGNGPEKYVFVGTTHGDEKGSKYLLDSWINELEANYPNIGSNKTIYVIPMLNPDAFNAGTRVNANNVDLNRNFPANNWKSTVKMPSGETLPAGGGTNALSEPESKAIASFITTHSPRLVMTYHSKGSMVIANESGDSVSLAQRYGSESGYFATRESALGTTFAYDTTGAMENWLHDKYGIPTLLIELKTHHLNEFSRNKSAMWAMIN